MTSQSAATLQDVATAAGVSRSLVSLVMNNSPKVAAQTRERVLATADELGYRPNMLARQLARQRTDALGVMLPHLHNPLFASILDGVSAAARRLGSDLVLVSSFGRTTQEATAARTAIDHRVAGLLLVSPSLPGPELAVMARTVPMVVTSRRLQNVDTVAVDEYIGARLAVEHLVALGHERIAHVAGLVDLSDSRSAAYAEVMGESGLGHLILVERGDYSEAGGQEAMRRLLSRNPRPTAVFAANDMSALGVMRTLQVAGLRVPDDVSVVGFDNTTLARSSYISLTSVDQPSEQMGALAVEMLHQRISDPGRPTRELLLPPTMHARSTSAHRPTGEAAHRIERDLGAGLYG